MPVTSAQVENFSLQAVSLSSQPVPPPKITSLYLGEWAAHVHEHDILNFLVHTLQSRRSLSARVNAPGTILAMASFTEDSDAGDVQQGHEN